MHNLEKCGDITYVDYFKAMPNSLSNGITAELGWTFIEMRERRNWFKTKWDECARFIKEKLIGNQDLDLGIYVEKKDGTKFLIDPIQFSRRGGKQNEQTHQGCLTKSPFVWHQGDDRGRNESSCERVYINPNGLRDIKRMYVYAFIWRGAAHWYTTDAKVQILIGGQPVVCVPLEQTKAKDNFCVAVEILPQNDMLQIKKLSTFHKNHSACDKAYNWGFRWTSGSK